MKRAKKMGRRRMIFGCISNSVKFNSLKTDQARLLYLLAYTHTDDFGRISASPMSIKLTVCPGLNYTTEQISEYFADIANAGLVRPYSVDGQDYMEFTDFESYQTFKREREPECPEPNFTALESSKSEVLERKDKGREEKIKEEKIKYAEFVLLTQEEYQSLVKDHGEPGAKRIIEILDNYKGANGKRYKSDYRAILNWVVTRYKQEKANPTGAKVVVHKQPERVEPYHAEWQNPYKEE